MLIEETIPGDGEILSNTHPFEEVSARLVWFEVPVARDKEAKIRYGVRFKY